MKPGETFTYTIEIRLKIATDFVSWDKGSGRVSDQSIKADVVRCETALSIQRLALQQTFPNLVCSLQSQFNNTINITIHGNYELIIYVISLNRKQT